MCERNAYQFHPDPTPVILSLPYDTQTGAGCDNIDATPMVNFQLGMCTKQTNPDETATWYTRVDAQEQEVAVARKARKLLK